MKVKDLFILWLEKYAKLGVKTRTYNKYEFIVFTRIIPEFGDYDINQITTTTLQEFILQLLENGNIKNFYAKDADALNIQLPSIDNEPDYKTMSLIISAIHKMVLKDVISYLNDN